MSTFIFNPWPKIPRYSREIIITEKIDGTNASIFIAPGSPSEPGIIDTWRDHDTLTDMVMLVGSRNRWITPEQDNAGFARWAKENCEQLRELGPGHHFGEWWGSGIQRGYDLPKGEKRFSLFNVSRWSESLVRPDCCDVVPVLYQGPHDSNAVQSALDLLRYEGSYAAPGFMRPEGIIIYHVAAGMCFKKTLDKDDKPKNESP